MDISLSTHTLSPHSCWDQATSPKLIQQLIQPSTMKVDNWVPPGIRDPLMGHDEIQVIVETGRKLGPADWDNDTCVTVRSGTHLKDDFLQKRKSLRSCTYKSFRANPQHQAVRAPNQAADWTTSHWKR